MGKQGETGWGYWKTYPQEVAASQPDKSEEAQPLEITPRLINWCRSGDCGKPPWFSGEGDNQAESQDPPQSHLPLAVENWGAPIIVTTTVQLLESLLACDPTRCRKPHNLAER